MKYGLLEYTTRNIGDEIQSVATRQYLPRVDTYLKRDHLDKVDSREKIKLIMNGWFSHHPYNWPPSPDIDPLFISFHISEKAEESYTSPESVRYLRDHEPIGCRDLYTRDLLKKHGVEAYFSGCLTMTLSNEQSNENSGEIYIVDVDSDVSDELPDQVNKQAENISHAYQTSIDKTEYLLFRFLQQTIPNKIKIKLKNWGMDDIYGYIWENINPPMNAYREVKFQKATDYLDKYAKAKLVITSRLHVTLPCIAFDTPVILVHKNPSDPRFSGLREYINLYSVDEFAKKDTERLLNNVSNPGDITKVIKRLEEEVDQFLNHS